MDQNAYSPPPVWSWTKESGGRFANINRPVAGATHERELPVGAHPLQLYSVGTPNGVKVTVMLEELLAIGHAGAEYDAWLVRINDGEQFGSGFVAVNPNSKIPALLDRSGPEPVRVFESGAILLYLAESRYLAGDDYTIADIAVWPWYGTLAKGQLYGAGEFLQVHTYTNVLRWTDEIARRPAVRRGRVVNRTWGQPSSQLHERHDASDFDLKTQDKLAAAG
jgi:glutathione S-transferase